MTHRNDLRRAFLPLALLAALLGAIALSLVVNTGPAQSATRTRSACKYTMYFGGDVRYFRFGKVGPAGPPIAATASEPGHRVVPWSAKSGYTICRATLKRKDNQIVRLPTGPKSGQWTFYHSDNGWQYVKVVLRKA